MNPSTHRSTFKITQPIRREIVKIIDERIKDVHVTKEDFSELKAIVKDLASAQKRTEVKLEELADAQKRTEVKLEELADAQKRTEVKLEELADAQKRTEVKLGQLTEAQIKIESQVSELAKNLNALVNEHSKTRKMLGGLSMSVGYGLEDKSYKALPVLLKRDFDLIVEGKLKRDYLLDKKGEFIEVNILGKAKKNDIEITIIGEGKAQLSKNDIDNFIKKKLKRFEGLIENIFPLLITYMTSEPDVRQYAKEKNIPLYYSYEFEI